MADGVFGTSTNITPVSNQQVIPPRRYNSRALKIEPEPVSASHCVNRLENH
jgi:hypothetical protein